MGGLTKVLFLGTDKAIQFSFQVLRFIVLIIVILCKYYRRVSCHYKYMSIIEKRSSKFIIRSRKNIPDLCPCTICLSEIGVGEEARELNCGHVFHRECLDKWLRCDGAANCPLCRRVVLPREMVVDYERVRSDEENCDLQKELALILLSTLHHRTCT